MIKLKADKTADIQCPRCNSLKIRKKGFEYYVKGKVQKYQCLECFRYWIDDKVINDNAKISTNVPKKENKARRGSRTA